MIISLGTRKACCKYECSKVNIGHLPPNGHPEIYWQRDLKMPNLLVADKRNQQEDNS